MTRGRIPIGDARRISEERGVPVIVIFAIHDDGARFTITTYGATKKMCRHAASLGEQFAKAIFDQTVAPAAVEPLQLPETATVMEIAKGGKP